METVFISGMPCSGKSHLTKRLVEHLGHNRAARVPMDHYFLDATCPEHHDQANMSLYQRCRIDWDLLFAHLSQLASGIAVDTPRYDGNNLRRVPYDAEVGRSSHLTPCAIVFVDGMHPSLNTSHKHVFVNPTGSLRDRLCQIRATEMPLPTEYTQILRQVELSPYRDSLAWLELNAWQKVNDPLSLNVEAFCRQCGWD
jgi:uridine kinase